MPRMAGPTDEAFVYAYAARPEAEEQPVMHTEVPTEAPADEAAGGLNVPPAGHSGSQPAPEAPIAIHHPPPSSSATIGNAEDDGASHEPSGTWQDWATPPWTVSICQQSTPRLSEVVAAIST